mmetsp:Transcript_773/g.2086  ORF Transcript_773/g.2086 Transcript_773/m.2086 type:complete len:251 (-) Transcript_773:362-1114(-)
MSSRSVRMASPTLAKYSRRSRSRSLCGGGGVGGVDNSATRMCGGEGGTWPGPSPFPQANAQVGTGPATAAAAATAGDASCRCDDRQWGRRSWHAVRVLGGGVSTACQRPDVPTQPTAAATAGSAAIHAIGAALPLGFTSALTPRRAACQCCALSARSSSATACHAPLLHVPCAGVDTRMRIGRGSCGGPSGRGAAQRGAALPPVATLCATLCAIAEQARRAAVAARRRASKPVSEAPAAGTRRAAWLNVS